MKELGTDDPARIRAHGAIDLPTLQRYLNFWCSSSLDLFGSEISSNSAANFASGLKGRPDETQYEDHTLRNASFKLLTPQGEQEVPMLNALNEVLRDDYVEDCERAVRRWNHELEKAGLPDRLALPSRRFHRHQGEYSRHSFDPAGNLIDAKVFQARHDEWLPSEADMAFLRSIMVPVHEIGKIAGWIAAPARGVDGKPFEYEYVKL
jgi:benzoyl-CoA 2,3-dioxygenase component B